jgi:hypothetical protein
MLSNNHQPSISCTHGRSKTDPQFTGYTCALCAEENFLRATRKVQATEREELAKELFVKFSVAKTFRDALTDEVAREAFKAADVFLRQRNEERRK